MRRDVQIRFKALAAQWGMGHWKGCFWTSNWKGFGFVKFVVGLGVRFGERGTFGITARLRSDQSQYCSFLAYAASSGFPDPHIDSALINRYQTKHRA